MISRSFSDRSIGRLTTTNHPCSKKFFSDASPPCRHCLFNQRVCCALPDTFSAQTQPSHLTRNYCNLPHDARFILLI